MEIIKPGTNIDFVGKRYIALTLSGLTILITILLLLWRGGPNFGVDFSGGTLIQIRLSEKRSAAEIKDALKSVALEDSIVQEFKAEGAGEYLIRVKKVEENIEGLGDRAQDHPQDAEPQEQETTAPPSLEVAGRGAAQDPRR